jgi:hypothetical protein
MTAADPPPQPARAYRLITSFADSRVAIDEVIDAARTTLSIFDTNLERMGFGNPGRIARVRAFLLAGRAHRLRIVLHDTSHVERHEARLLALLRELPASIAIHRTLGEACRATDPLVLADDHSVWHQFHHDQPRASVALHASDDAKLLVERFDALWELSEQAVSSAPPLV